MKLRTLTPDERKALAEYRQYGIEVDLSQRAQNEKRPEVQRILHRSVGRLMLLQADVILGVVVTIEGQESYYSETNTLFSHFVGKPLRPDKYLVSRDGQQRLETMPTGTIGVMNAAYAGPEVELVVPDAVVPFDTEKEMLKAQSKFDQLHPDLVP